MYRNGRLFFIALSFLTLQLFLSHATAEATTTHLQRAFMIVMENQGFDNVIGHNDANGKADTPYITELSRTYGLETYYFGVTHPSLPNYLSMIGGYYNNLNDDDPSCYAVPRPSGPCHSIPHLNIVDQLEEHAISWAAFEQSMPTAGYLGLQYPAPPGPRLYAQKHNPFVYFTDIVKNQARLSHILPLDNAASQLSRALANPATAPRFVFIAPDQCHDMHGASTCQDNDALLRSGDSYVATLVNSIKHSRSFTSDSAIFLTWDENDFSSNLGCCNSPAIGGGHVATIVITPRYTHQILSAQPANHYSLLATIEDALGLSRLSYAKFAQPLFGLLP